MDRRGILLALLLLLSAALLLEPEGSLLVEPDEARYALISREMLDSGDFVTPTYNGAHYFEKPPLLYWAEAASMAVLGRNEYAARLPARLSALGTAAALALALGGEAGLWAALLFLSAPLAFGLGRANVTDGVLSLCTTLAFLSLRSFLLARERGGSGRGALAAAGAACGLAVLAKGLIGVVLPGLTLLAWAALTGRWVRVREAVLSPAPPVFLAVAAPWFVLVEAANPGFSGIFFLREHLQRFATDVSERPGPPWYFLAVFAAGFLPWLLLLPSAVRPLGGPLLRDLRRRPDDLYLALWVAVVIVFFSFSRSKLYAYVLPAFPAAAALVARSAAREGVAGAPALPAIAAFLTAAAAGGLAWGSSGGAFADHGIAGYAVAAAVLLPAAAWAGVLLGRRDRRRGLLAIGAGVAGVALLVVLAFPRVVPVRTAEELARRAALEPGATVACYACFHPSFPWVLGRSVVVTDHEGELATDGVRPPALYWEKDEFWRRWNSGERMLAVSDDRWWVNFLRRSRVPPRLLAADGDRILVENHGP